jgi:hypothetical protein
MPALSEIEKTEICRLWNDPDPDWAMNTIVPYKTRETIEKFVINEMREDGMELSPNIGDANLWGGELANRMRCMLINSVMDGLIIYRDNIHSAVC